MVTGQNPKFVNTPVKAGAKKAKMPAKRYFEALTELADSVPEEELSKLPSDGSINYRHYLYGYSKVEQ